MSEKLDETIARHAAKPQNRKRYKCATCGVPVGYWYHGWKHQNGGGGKPSCGKPPVVVEDLERKPR
jgi:hypothetical protein